MIHKNQETNYNINVKVKFKKYFQLKFIFNVPSWLYYSAMEIYQVYHIFFKKILDTNIQTKRFNYY